MKLKLNKALRAAVMASFFAVAANTVQAASIEYSAYTDDLKTNLVYVNSFSNNEAEAAASTISFAGLNISNGGANVSADNDGGTPNNTPKATDLGTAFNGTGFTVSMDLDVTSISNWRNVFCFSTSGGEVDWQKNGSGTFELYGLNALGSGTTLNSNSSGVNVSSLTGMATFTIVLDASANTLTHYVNGEKASTLTFTFGEGITPNYNVTGIAIGDSVGSQTRACSGSFTLDNLAVWNTALTDDQVSSLIFIAPTTDLTEGAPATAWADLGFTDTTGVTINVTPTEATDDFAAVTVGSDVTVGSMEVTGGALVVDIAEDATFSVRNVSAGNGASFAFSGDGTLSLTGNLSIGMSYAPLSGLTGTLELDGCTLTVGGSGNNDKVVEVGINAATMVIKNGGKFSMMGNKAFSTDFDLQGGTLEIRDGLDMGDNNAVAFAFNGAIKVSGDNNTLVTAWDKHVVIAGGVEGDGTLNINGHSQGADTKSIFDITTAVVNTGGIVVNNKAAVNLKEGGSITGPIKLGANTLLNAETSLGSTTITATDNTTIQLASGVTLADSSLSKNNGVTVTLAGAGQYDLAATAAKATFGSDWTGKVVVTTTGATGLNLSTLGNANSTIEIKGFTGYLNNARGEDNKTTITSNIILTNTAYVAAVELTNCYPGNGMDKTTGDHYIFQGSISGSGNFITSYSGTANQNSRQYFDFMGDVSGYTGHIRTNTGSSVFTFGVNATVINAEIKVDETSDASHINNAPVVVIENDQDVTVNKAIHDLRAASDRKLDLTVKAETEGGSNTTTFNGVVDVRTLTVGVDSKAVLKANSGVNAVALASGAAIEVAHYDASSEIITLTGTQGTAISAYLNLMGGESKAVISAAEGTDGTGALSVTNANLAISGASINVNSAEDITVQAQITDSALTLGGSSSYTIGTAESLYFLTLENTAKAVIDADTTVSAWTTLAEGTSIEINSGHTLTSHALVQESEVGTTQKVAVVDGQDKATITGKGMLSVATGTLTYTNAFINVEQEGDVQISAALVNSTVKNSNENANVTVDTSSWTAETANNVVATENITLTVAPEQTAVVKDLSVASGKTVKVGDGTGTAEVTGTTTLTGGTVNGSVKIASTGSLIITEQATDTTPVAVTGDLTFTTDSQLNLTALNIDSAGTYKLANIGGTVKGITADNLVGLGAVVANNLEWALKLGTETILTSAGYPTAATSGAFTLSAGDSSMLSIDVIDPASITPPPAETLTATAITGAMTTGTITSPGVLTLKLDKNAAELAAATELSITFQDDTVWSDITAGKDMGGYVTIALVGADGTDPVTLQPGAIVGFYGYEGVPGQTGTYFVGYIPEPATATLSLLALAALAARRRRK